MCTKGASTPSPACNTSLLSSLARRAVHGGHSRARAVVRLRFWISIHDHSFHVVQRSSPLVLESRRVRWGPRPWSWRAAGRAGVLTPGPGEPQGALGSSPLVLESRRACWGPHPWSWRAAGCGWGPQPLVLESRRVCWGPHPWSWRAAGCAGVLTPGPGEPQGALGSSPLVLESRRVRWGPHSWSWRATGCTGFRCDSALN